MTTTFKPPYMETWAEMSMRHEKERYDQVTMLAEDYTQTEAAKILDTTLQGLNNYIRRNGIEWKKIKQGVKSRDMQD